MSKKSFKKDLLPDYYVAIGASAGGLEALDLFFSQMPENTGLAFIVIQHLSPDYKSLMVELLSKRTFMNVLRAEDGMLVEANKVYLIPPNKEMSIFHGKIILKEMSQKHGFNLPIDIFFRSLAQDQHEKAIGIVLSGTGSDGVRGIRAIKEQGGLLIVQTENSARFDGMPRSAIATGLADLVLDPSDMPGKLLSILKFKHTLNIQKSAPVEQTEKGMNRIFQLLRDKTDLDFTYYKPSTVYRRIERRITVHQLKDLEGYVSFLENHPQEINTLYRELLIGVTSFFRDPEVYDGIEHKVIPEIFKNAADDAIRVWIAGCSSGEEAYSMAILFQEYRRKNNLKTTIKIFATDVDKNALFFAGNGIYPESIGADMDRELLNRYFSRSGDQYHIDHQIRKMVVFAQHNIIKDPPFTNIDFLSCRNLLIYLQPSLQQKVFEMFIFSLYPKGYMLLGSSETPGDLSQYFKVLDSKMKIFQTKGHKLTIKDKHIVEHRLNRPQLHFYRHDMQSVPDVSPVSQTKLLDRLLNTMNDQDMPLTVIVDEAYEIQYILGDSSGFLSVPAGKSTRNFVKMLNKELSIPFSTGLQKVFQKGEKITHNHLRVVRNKDAEFYDVVIRLLKGNKNDPELAAVFFFRSKEEKEAVTRPTSSYDINQDADQRIKDLEQELQFNKENLQATIEELETSNEELQATNEELLASNEELQSTNEELQSVNEELYTVNAEYQVKIVELTEMTNDMDNLMSSSGVGTLFLDENLEIRKFTPQVTEIFNILDSDIGRPLHDLSHSCVSFRPVQWIKKVLKDEKMIQKEILTKQGKWYLMNISPYKITEKDYSGIIVSFTEITRLKATEEKLKREKELLNNSQKMYHIGGWEWDASLNKVYWSDEVYYIHGLTPGKIKPGSSEHIEKSLKCYPEKDREKIAQAFQKCTEEGKSYDLICDFIDFNNNKKKIRTKAYAKKIRGKVVKVIGTIMDLEA